MNPEIVEILETIEAFSARRSFGSFLAETCREKILLSIAGVSLVAAVVLVFIESLRLFGFIAGALFLLSLVALVLVQASSMVAAFHTPLKGYAKAAEARFRQRIEYVSSLSTFSAEALEATRSTLESDTARMQARLGLLVGAVEKAGFIPAALALYYAASKVYSGAASFPSTLLMSFVFGLYAGAFLGHRLIEALRYNISCVGEAKDVALRREVLQRPNNRFQPTGQASRMAGY